VAKSVGERWDKKAEQLFLWTFSRNYLQKRLNTPMQSTGASSSLKTSTPKKRKLKTPTNTTRSSWFTTAAENIYGCTSGNERKEYRTLHGEKGRKPCEGEVFVTWKAEVTVQKTKGKQKRDNGKRNSRMATIGSGEGKPDETAREKKPTTLESIIQKGADGPRKGGRAESSVSGKKTSTQE